MIPRYKLAKRAFLREVNSVRALYVLSLVGFVLLAFYIAHSNVSVTGEKVAGDFRHRDSLMAHKVGLYSNAPAQRQQLKELFFIVNTHKSTYLYLAERFSSYSFAFALMFPVCSVIAGLLGFVIVKKGWDNLTDFYMKSSFLVFFFFSSLFGLLPQVYNTKDNIARNMQKYHECSKAEIDIFNLLNDNKGYMKAGKADSLNPQIQDVYAQLKQCQDLFFDVNMDKVPSEVNPTVVSK